MLLPRSERSHVSFHVFVQGCGSSSCDLPTLVWPPFCFVLFCSQPYSPVRGRENTLVHRKQELEGPNVATSQTRERWTGCRPASSRPWRPAFGWERTSDTCDVFHAGTCLEGGASDARVSVQDNRVRWRGAAGPNAIAVVGATRSLLTSGLVAFEAGGTRGPHEGCRWR